ncbi:hypothetical protein U2G91_06465 [Rhodococcoides fascians]|uniref:hypothetical protein n=1 Tax=Rhodococcoides fascians TaxID=1828 RepID=UPI002ACE395D|nr:hypothetical protein [Rhodococcus fascians]WQH29584.1 hypothetical protein U2G91_06465 [Rhodococcus fascians]
MADGFEPTSVRLRDVPIGREVTNGVLSLGFYVVCGLIGLLPGPVADRACRYRGSGELVPLFRRPGTGPRVRRAGTVGGYSQ